MKKHILYMKLLALAMIVTAGSLPAFAATYFHVTDAKNVESIMANGLLTSFGGNKGIGFSSKFMGDSTPCRSHIHLGRFLTHYDAARNGIWQGTDVRGYLEMAAYYGRETVLLGVELTPDQVAQLKSDPVDGFAVRADFDIPADQIKILGSGHQWAKLLAPCKYAECTFQLP